MGQRERQNQAEDGDAGDRPPHARDRRKPSVAVREPSRMPATITAAMTYLVDVRPTPGRTCAYVAAAKREASSQAPPTSAPARAPASAPVIKPSITNGPRSIHPRAPRSRVIVTSSLRDAATPRIELALTSYATTGEISSSVAPTAPLA